MAMNLSQSCEPTTKPLNCVLESAFSHGEFYPSSAPPPPPPKKRNVFKSYILATQNAALFGNRGIADVIS